MDKEKLAWLEENVSKFIGAGDRVKYGQLQRAFEVQIRVILDNAELFKWLKEKEMPVSHLREKNPKRKVGWPLGKPRKKLERSIKYAKKVEYVDQKDGISEITAYLYGGQILIRLDDAKRISAH